MSRSAYSRHSQGKPKKCRLRELPKDLTHSHLSAHSPGRAIPGSQSQQERWPAHQAPPGSVSRCGKQLPWLGRGCQPASASSMHMLTLRTMPSWLLSIRTPDPLALEGHAVSCSKVPYTFPRTGKLQGTSETSCPLATPSGATSSSQASGGARQVTPHFLAPLTHQGTGSK